MLIAHRLLVVATVTIASLTPAQAQPVEDPNYTTQNLMIFNARDEILLQRNFMGWSTPGTRYDKRLTIEESLADLAQTYGVRICRVRLAGLFSYRYGYTPAISSRSHYSVRLAGGVAQPPSGFAELRWVDRPTALRLMAESSQKSPPALVELTRQMLTVPDRIWGGAFSIWQEGESYRSRTLQPFEVLGYSDPHPPGSADRTDREAACE
ncbi:MAG: NUDIX hydrolase [Altererythrobacter sp.]|nr:NUDIX hydrolase [Altererythrobacter sp.]